MYSDKQIEDDQSDEIDEHSIFTISSQIYDTTQRLEEFPHEDLYRARDSVSGEYRSRPSLPKLHENRQSISDNDDHQLALNQDLKDKTNAQGTAKNPVKLGWCSGVMLRGVLSIIGTMLFLRHGYVMGQSGILIGCAIIVVSTILCLITSFSLSAIATNGTIKGGGAYFLLSRSLGPEWGSAIGIVLTLSNCLACALCVVGFAETVKSILLIKGVASMVDYVNDIRIISVITLCMLMIIVMASIRFETAIMYMLFVVLVISMVNFVVGSFMPVTIERLMNGFVGYSLFAIKTNIRPKLTDGMHVGRLFGIFFPSMTGVLAGVNISGNLKDPTTAIPKGTILALLFSSGIYLFSGIIYTSTLLPVAPGPSYLSLLDSNFGNCTSKNYNANCTLDLNIPLAYCQCFSKINVDQICKENLLLSNQNESTSNFQDKCENIPCTYDYYLDLNSWLSNDTFRGGSLHDYNIMKSISAYPPLIYAGIFAATLSSASAAFVSGPKVFQALCRDNVLPKAFKFLAHGNQMSDEPQRIYVLEFFINCCLVLIGNLNQIAVLVAQFTMISYVFINYAAFDMERSKCIGWRPAFRLYNSHVSLIGALGCLISMFIVGVWSALLTFGVVFLVFLFVKQRKPDINWGSSPDAKLYTRGLKNLHKFAIVGEHVKHFRPQCLILAGSPTDRQEMLRLFASMLKSHQLGICANVLNENQIDISAASVYYDKAVSTLKSMNLKLFYTQIVSADLRTGVRALVQCSGIGTCRPNVAVLGFKRNWWDPACSNETRQYFDILHDLFDLNMSVVVYRHDSNSVILPTAETNKRRHFTLETINEEKNDELMEFGGGLSPMDALLKESPSKENMKRLFNPFRRFFSSTSKSTNENVQNVTNASNIDIWWLFDDGGLTVLLPYLLSKTKEWSSCKIRVFALVESNQAGCNVSRHRQFANLLAKFRINYEAIHMIHDFDKHEENEEFNRFNLMVQELLENRNSLKSEKFLNKDELKMNQTKTLRHVRLKCALKKHSQNAKIIFITMTVPRKNTISAHLYMAWLEFVSRGLPPVMFVRGNQQSVLTYYS